MVLDYPAIIADESARFLEILRSGPLDAPVPGCPAWTLGDLGLHLAGVQRWAAHVVTVGVAGEPDTAPPVPADAADALADATRGLVAALDAADPHDPCWNFGSGPQLKSFWFRRQALEVAVHRWDAESAVTGTPAPLTADVATDVIDEFVHVTLGRVIDREGIDLGSLAGDVHLHCTDTPGEWTFEVVDQQLVTADQHRRAAVAVRGEAADLALFVYNRAPATEVEVLGDDDVLAGWGRVFEF